MKKTGTEFLNPKTKDILMLLGVGALVVGSLVMPGIPLILKPILDKKREDEVKEWNKYNPWRLKQLLRRLEKQKFVEVKTENGSQVVSISDHGRKKVLKYKLEEMRIDQKKWDGRWRIVMYDIDTRKRKEREFFHTMLKNLRFYQLQESVYLSPFPCKDEIEYLKQIAGLKGEVTVITVQGIDNETAYKSFFGL